MREAALVFIALCTVECAGAIGRPWSVAAQPSRGDLAADLERVTGVRPRQGLGESTLIPGTPGKSPAVDRSVKEGGIDGAPISGAWKSFYLLPGRTRSALSVLPVTAAGAPEHHSRRNWETSVKDSVRTMVSTHTLLQAGYHVLKFRMLDPGVVVPKFIIDLGGLKASDLGPPESFH